MPRRFKVYGAPLPAPDPKGIRIIGPLPGKGGRMSWLFLVGGLGLVALVIYLMKKKNPTYTPAPTEAGQPYFEPASPTGRKILNRQRANGVTAKLQVFLDDWVQNGPFDLGIGEDGGLRTDALKQLKYFLTGASKAKYLDETPHGRGGAIDCYPVINGKYQGDSEAESQDPKVRALFKQMADFAKSRHGLVWGGDFKSFYDGPHLEVPGWRNLPMPGANVA